MSTARPGDAVPVPASEPTPSPPGVAARWPLAAPPVALGVLALLAAASLLYAASAPVVVIGLAGGACVAAPLGLALTVDWGVRAVACLVVRRSSIRDLRWYVLPVLAAMVVAGSVTAWPLRLRFALSRSAFEAAAAALLAGESADAAPGVEGPFTFRADGRRLGTYDVLEVAAAPTERVVLFVTGAMDGALWDFAYAPAGAAWPPVAVGNVRVGVRALSPDWSAFVWRNPRPESAPA